MGGGFYDRTFAFKKRQPGIGPLLVGVAHSCQESRCLNLDPWDIPLDMVVTDKNVFSQQARQNYKGKGIMSDM